MAADAGACHAAGAGARLELGRKGSMGAVSRHRLTPDGSMQASYDDWRRARRQWDYFYRRK